MLPAAFLLFTDLGDKAISQYLGRSAAEKLNSNCSLNVLYYEEKAASYLLMSLHIILPLQAEWRYCCMSDRRR